MGDSGMMFDLEKLLGILRGHEMEIQFAYDPASGLIGTDQEHRLLSLAKERQLEAHKVRLALPTIHDLDDLAISAAGMQAAAEVTCRLADAGLLDQTGKVIVERYLVGVSFLEGKIQEFPTVRELRTKDDYKKLHFGTFPTRTNKNHPGYHLVTFSLEGERCYYWGIRGDYMVPVFLRSKQGVIPFVFGDDSELAMGLRSKDRIKRTVSYYRRVDHFAKQFFAPNEGMVILIAGDMDFVDPAGVSVYQKDDKIYIQAVHADFKHSRYLQARLEKKRES